MYDKLKELAVAEIGKSSLSSSRKDSSSVRNQPLLRMKTKKNSNGFIPAKKNLSSSWKRSEFQEKINRSYQSYQRISRKDLPFGERSSLSVESGWAPPKSNRDPKILKCITIKENDDIESVISPLIKIMREKLEKKEKKELKKQMKINDKKMNIIKLADLNPQSDSKNLKDESSKLKYKIKTPMKSFDKTSNPEIRSEIDFLPTESNAKKRIQKHSRHTRNYSSSDIISDPFTKSPAPKTTGNLLFPPITSSKRPSKKLSQIHRRRIPSMCSLTSNPSSATYSQEPSNMVSVSSKPPSDSIDRTSWASTTHNSQIQHESRRSNRGGRGGIKSIYSKRACQQIEKYRRYHVDQEVNSFMLTGKCLGVTCRGLTDV